jgi:hypothetical protein
MLIAMVLLLDKYKKRLFQILKQQNLEIYNWYWYGIKIILDVE